MKNKKRISSFILFSKVLVFTMILFLSTVAIDRFKECDTSEPAKLFQLSQAKEKNEVSTTEFDQQIINSILNAKVKYIEFSDSKKYDQERKIVYKFTNMAESEKYSEGSMKKAIIRIALEDLNDDGVNEILAYINQFAWCGRGGGHCTFLILERNSNQNWKELFKILTYPDIGIANKITDGYYDIYFRNVTFRVNDKKKK